MEYDFSGWATRNNIRCSDGRIIRKDAFKDNDGKRVPLVWNHDHNDPSNVLGHAILENREEGVYAYCKLNDTERADHARALIKHGDIDQLSIYANKLKQQGGNVLHGAIREVSLVLAGANPLAFIDSVIMHSDSGFEEIDEAVIYPGECSIEHSNAGTTDETEEKEEVIEHADAEKEKNMPENNEKTVKDVFDSMTEEQKNVVYFMIGQALEDNGNAETGGEENMKHNVFDQEEQYEGNALSHSDMAAILADGKRYGSLKDSFLAHAETYGIENLEYLFPEAREVNRTPEFIKRDMGWVQKVMSATHHVPFSRIKTTFADITEDEARAKGYMKGKLKKEEVFSLLKRTTTPTTIYKKQKMDRDDIIDITDFDVVAWLKAEMRMMLDEEIARAILIGDGRLMSSDDKINEQNIRPVMKDEELFTIQKTVDVKANASADEKAHAFIRAAIKARKDYKGSGQPTLYTTEDMVTDMLLLTDANGRDLYESETKLATKLRVKEIVVVPPMEGVMGKNDLPLMGIIVNLNDYDNGADKGGAINMFDDFDIDYNQQKYLIETRCSGALVKPYSAIALTLNEAKA